MIEWFDSNGRLEKTQDQNGVQTEYTYNDRGLLHTITSDSNQSGGSGSSFESQRVTYDDMNRPIEELGPVFEFYDENEAETLTVRSAVWTVYIDNSDVEGATNYNFLGADFNNEVAQLDKSKPVLLYCRSGKRSGAASKKLQGMGFKEIYDLQGGFLNWTKAQGEK